MIKNCYPCILMLNDIHVSKDNIKEFTLNWNEAVQICIQRGTKIIALGGDLFMSRAAQTLDVLLAVHDAFLRAKQYGIEVYVINGNHDKVNQEEIRGYCHIYNQHSNVTVVDEFLSLGNDEWNFVLHMIPYFPEDGSFVDRLNTVVAGSLSRKKYNLLYIHEGINGALRVPSDNELPTKIFKAFDKVFVGHYHNRCIIRDTQIEYIGSSRQHNFGEDEIKGYTLLCNDGSTQFIQNNANMRYTVIDIPDEQVNIHLTDLLDEIKEFGRCKVKVRVHSTSAKAKNIDKNTIIKAGASKVEIITNDPDVPEIVSTSLFEKFDGRKIQENYTEFCKEKNISNPDLGLSYLSKIDIHHVESN